MSPLSFPDDGRSPRELQRIDTDHGKPPECMPKPIEGNDAESQQQEHCTAWQQ